MHEILGPGHHPTLVEYVSQGSVRDLPRVFVQGEILPVNYGDMMVEQWPQ
jgi:hypothetical protein